MRKRIGLLTLIFFLILSIHFLSFPASSSQFSSKTLSLKTTRYELDVRVDYKAKKVFGNCRLTVHNPTDKPISDIPLLLYRLLKVTAITDERGRSIPFQQEVLSFEDWEQLQVSYTEVLLPNPIAAGQSKTIGIVYEGYLFGYSNDGWMYVKDHISKDFTFMRMDGFGYPVVGYPSDKANRRSGLQSYDYILSVTIPEDLVVANGGKLTGKSTIEGKTTYTYTNLKPAWRMTCPSRPTASSKTNRIT